MGWAEEPVHSCVALVLQGGGALGAYPAGVFQALDKHGSMPDWVAGTSIGTINATIIAGNQPDVRLDRLRTFWDRVSHVIPYHGLPVPAPMHDASMRAACSNAPRGAATSPTIPASYCTMCRTTPGRRRGKQWRPPAAASMRPPAEPTTHSSD